ncbi:hypothetical protein V6N12_068398 [Hibiscus sabdariffa]|uniref:Uncharacterized protein n=1 Tax=Hibiscus sabdariffa TaxID=183260 RepID=A0ABR2FQD0_9ROSI
MLLWDRFHNKEDHYKPQGWPVLIKIISREYTSERNKQAAAWTGRYSKQSHDRTNCGRCKTHEPNRVDVGYGRKASSKLSGSLSTNKQNKSLIASVERYKSLTLLNLGGLSLELSPELELSSEVSSWIGAGEGGGVMFCGRSTTCDGVTSCSSTKYGKKS